MPRVRRLGWAALPLWSRPPKNNFSTGSVGELRVKPSGFQKEQAGFTGRNFLSRTSFHRPFSFTSTLPRIVLHPFLICTSSSFVHPLFFLDPNFSHGYDYVRTSNDLRLYACARRDSRRAHSQGIS